MGDPKGFIKFPGCTFLTLHNCENKYKQKKILYKMSTGVIRPKPIGGQVGEKSYSIGNSSEQTDAGATEQDTQSEVLDRIDELERKIDNLRNSTHTLTRVKIVSAVILFLMLCYIIYCLKNQAQKS